MKTLKPILLSTLLFFLFYLLGAFYSASFNINNWQEGTRALISFFGGSVSLLAGFSFFIRLTDK